MQLVGRRRVGATIARACSSSGSISSSQMRISSSSLLADVVVEAAGGEPGRLGQVLHRGRVVAALGERRAAGVDDLLLPAVVAGAQGGAGGGEAADIAEASANPNDHSKFERSFGMIASAMDFDLSDDHALLQRTVRDFAQAEVAPVAEELDRDEGASRTRSCASSASWA